MDSIKRNQLDPWMQRVPKAAGGGVVPPDKELSGRGEQPGLAKDAEAEWKPPELSESKKDKECDRPHDRVDCDEV